MQELTENASLAASDYFLQGDITKMALALDATMAQRGFRGWLRRWRYQRVWGVKWTPLFLAAIDSLDAPLAQGSARYERSLAHTAL